jgi:hypothetical protein
VVGDGIFVIEVAVLGSIELAGGAKVWNWIIIQFCVDFSWHLVASAFRQKSRSAEADFKDAAPVPS